MKIDVSKLTYADVEKAFAEHPFLVKGIEARGNRVVLECARPRVIL